VRLLPILLALLPATAPAADLLLEGGNVYESATAAPRKVSVLIRDGTVLFVGDPDQARSSARSPERIDLRGGFVFPGWADAHGHLVGLGKSLEIADLKGAKSAAEAASRLGAAAKALPPAAWVEGRGWDQNLWPGKAFPDAAALDAALPGRVVVARRVDGHAVWVSSAALAAAGITASTADPPGGRILRRADESPSGVLVDNAMDLLDPVTPAQTPADLERRFLAATRSCARAGLTEVQDASGYGADEIAALERLAAAGSLPIRVYATISPEPASLSSFFAKGPRVGRGGDFLTVRAIKAVSDGALGSRGAALLEDYSDETGRRGLLVTPPERLSEVARQARQAGWQLWIHAIGDQGNRISLDAFRDAGKSSPQAPPGGQRPRIEHAQVLDPQDIPRFAREGVIASIQPTHATSDMPWAPARLGPRRVAGAYAWRSLVRAGARLAGGSDFPVESEKPLLGFYAAITRQDLEGKPPGGWTPGEKLTRPEALALFTSDTAFASFEEDRRGRIAPGFEADLTVLREDPMTAEVRRIPAIPVVLTVVGGRIAYRSEGSTTQ
jgi:predicted amidohydrolase YtcJ